MRLKTFALCSTALIAAAASAAGAQTSTPAGGAASSDQTPVANPATASQPQTDTGTPADRASPTVAPSDEAAGDGADVVVTGYRASLRSAASLKRNASQVVDAVVAEDIGKLPDLAVSDTAARIPGVQVIRLGGEANRVLIRGLPETFFNTLYNGREIFTAERRQVALQDFPSAGIAALEVFKTATADQVEPGVIGLTNVRSRRPFDIEGFQIAGNAWGLHTAESGSVTPNGNLLISDRWQTGIGEIGLLVNASYTELRYLDSEPSNTDFIASPTINGVPVRLPDIQRLYYRSGDRTRPSGNAAFQWRPNDKLEFYAEGLYQGFRNSIDDTEAQVPLYGGASYSNIVLRPGTNLVSSGTVVQAAGGPRLFSFRGGTSNKTDTYQYAIGGIYDSGPLRLTADVARTTSTFTGSTESIDREFGINGYTVNFDNETPQFSISGFNAADPSQYTFLGLFEEAQQSKGQDWQARIDGQYKFDGSFLNSLQFGLRYTDRNAQRYYGNRYFGGQNVPITQAPIDYVPVQPGFGTTDIQPFRTFLAPTYESIRANILNLRRFVIGLGAGNYSLANVAPDAFSSYTANEKTYAAYGQLNYNFNDVVDGTVGVRALRSETEVNGNAIIAGVVTPVSTGPKRTVYLPNASLRWHIVTPLQLRLSYTQTQTRPDFSQINPAINVGSPDPQNNNLRIGSGGNPALKPYRSDNYDASLEYYFSRNGFAAVAGFQRDIRDFIETETTQYTDPMFGLVQVSRPINVSKVKIRGIEGQISTFFDFDFLPTFLRSFGFQANYTYIDQTPQVPLISKHTYNIVGLFENGPVSARVTYNKRSRFLDDGFPQDRGNDIFYQYGRPTGTLDLSTNLNFTKNTTLFFDATNLTGKPMEYDFSSARDGAPRAEYVRFLRFTEQTFSVGLRFRH